MFLKIAAVSLLTVDMATSAFAQTAGSAGQGRWQRKQSGRNRR
jgi:hypothetical protein